MEGRAKTFAQAAPQGPPANTIEWAYKPIFQSSTLKRPHPWLNFAPTPRASARSRFRTAAPHRSQASSGRPASPQSSIAPKRQRSGAKPHRSVGSPERLKRLRNAGGAPLRRPPFSACSVNTVAIFAAVAYRLLWPEIRIHRDESG